MRYSGGGRFCARSPATSIGAADGRLFRLRKTAMLSRHWRLWLSFPPPGPLPKTIFMYRSGLVPLRRFGG